MYNFPKPTSVLAGAGFLKLRLDVVEGQTQESGEEAGHKASRIRRDGRVHTVPLKHRVDLREARQLAQVEGGGTQHRRECAAPPAHDAFLSGDVAEGRQDAGVVASLVGRLESI